MANVLSPHTSTRLLQRLPELGSEDAPAFLACLMRDPLFLRMHILPLLALRIRGHEPQIVATFGTREASTCMHVFVWPVGATTPIHDHTSWGAYHCVSGSLLEERYTRLDDGAQPGTAHLRRQWRRKWSRADGSSLVGAYVDGIHRVANPDQRLAISVHLYGPRLGAFDGRDYDPRHDFVCDRLEPDDMVLRPALSS
jgi:hypothetical protein